MPRASSETSFHVVAYAAPPSSDSAFATSPTACVSASLAYAVGGQPVRREDGLGQSTQSSA